MRPFVRSAPRFALIFVLAACADQPTAPSSVQPEVAVSEKIIINHIADDQMSADFTVTSTGGSFQLGPHAIYFPKNAICDPATSTYGPTEWDKPCQALRSPIRIHAEVLMRGGMEVVDFTPALRFVPNRNASKWVWIFMRSSASADPSELAKASILWTPFVGAPGIDESLGDPSLRTRYSPHGGGLLYRRVKHFSGYQVSVGFSDSGGTDAGSSGASY